MNNLEFQARRALPLVFVATLLAALPQRQAVAAVILDTLKFEGHTYHLLGGDSTGAGIDWIDAEAFAVTLGGHLVTIDSAAEDSILASTWAGATFGAFPSAWGLYIGINDASAAVEGDYTWVSGDPVTYTNWAPGEPNNFFGGVEDYGIIWGSWNGASPMWNDVDNFSTQALGTIPRPMYAIAEVSEPTTTALLTLGLLAAGFARKRRTH